MRWLPKTGLAVVCAVAWSGIASAQPHRLTVVTGNLFNGDSTTDPDETRIEHVYAAGVGGLGQNYFVYSGSVDSDTGALALSAQFGLEGGAGDPIVVPLPVDSYSSIYQVLDPGLPFEEFVSVTATLEWRASALLVSQSGDVDRADATARLDVAGCYVTVIRRIYSNGTIDDSVTGSSESATCEHEGGPSLLRVTRTRTAASLTGATTFPVEAIIDGATGSIEYQDYGQLVMAGQLGVDTSGADFTPASPTFLSVPEPAASTIAVAGLVALAGIVRTRRA
jgi:hypothetical protein